MAVSSPGFLHRDHSCSFSNSAAHNMPFVPTEILQIVVSHLESSWFHPNTFKNPVRRRPDVIFSKWSSLHLASYTSFSRQWQGVVERLIWKRIVLTRSDSVDKFRQFSSGNSSHRAHFVRYILWNNAIYGETKEDENLFRTERMLSDGLETWVRFYQQKWLPSLRKLFIFLNSWGETHPGVSLALSSRKQYWREWIPDDENEMGLEDPAYLTADELFEDQEIPYPIRLTEDALLDFPGPPYVKDLELYNWKNSTIRLDVFCRIAKSLPSIATARAGEGDHIPPYAALAILERRLSEYLTLLFLTFAFCYKG